MDNGLTPDKYCCQLARNNFGNCKKYGFLATIILIVQNYYCRFITQAMDLEKILVIGVNQILLLKLFQVNIIFLLVLFFLNFGHFQILSYQHLKPVRREF